MPHAPPARLRILDVEIDNWTMEQALASVVDAASGSTPRTFFFVNAHCLNIAHRRPDFRRALAGATAVFGDGVGVRMAGRLLRQPVRDNVNGTDLFPLLCAEAQRRDLSLFLLGAQPGVAEEAARRAVERWPGLRIAGTLHGFFAPDEEHRIRERIAASGAHILLVALGVPAQELWLERHRESLGVGACLGVGGLFDFYSGRIRRAPPWMRRAGLEWCWRMLQEPGRLAGRYLAGNPIFLLRVLMQRLARPR